MNKRESGILLHMTSLPSRFGIGDLGRGARRFADFLAASGQRLWQILPMTPADTTYGNSPYHSFSSFAWNTLLISPDLLVEDGLLNRRDLAFRPEFPDRRVDYSAVWSFKRQVLGRAYERFRAGPPHEAFRRFCLDQEAWLKDYALFRALKSHFNGTTWCKWPVEYRDRHEDALQAAQERFREHMEQTMFLQYLFQEQWLALKAYCNGQSIRVIGDLPIYVVYDSVDVWTHPEIFNLDEEKQPVTVAGVPPDYFSETGQLWGNPVYRWDVLRENDYDWWIQRIRHNLSFFDHVRIDHFRGFVQYWEVPAQEKTALKGRWSPVPAEDFFNTLLKRMPNLPLIAEDLGYITPDVTEVMERFGFPGMKVLLFAFGPDLPTNPYVPHNHTVNSIIYTGTHDNNTILGWFEDEAKPEDKERFGRYVGHPVTKENVHREFIRLALMSVANTAILPMQDVLGLGGTCRMNRPATKKGNWEWRVTDDQLDDAAARDLRTMTEMYGRL